MPLRFIQFHIRNFMGIAECDIEAGQITRITGRNGAGKSSRIEAIKNLLLGGNDQEAIRNGCDYSEIVGLLSDGRKLRKRTTRGAKAADFDILAPNGKPERAPAAKLKEFLDAVAVDPRKFIDAPEKEQYRILLEVIPLQVTEQELRAAAAGVELDMRDIDCSQHALPVIETVHRRIYESRTGVNSRLRDKEGHVRELQEAIPPETEEPISAAGLQTELYNLQADLRDYEKEVRRCGQESIDEMSAASDKAIAEIRKRMEAEISQVRDQAAQQKEQILADERKFVAHKRSEIDPEIARVTGELGRIEEVTRAATKAKLTRDNLQRARLEAGELETTTKAMTSALANLEDLKRQKASQIPIPGLEIKDEGFYLDGVKWTRTAPNTAAKIEFFFRLAVLRSKDLPFVVFDGIESLDEETLAGAEEYARRKGISIVYSRMLNSDLEIESV